MPHLLQVGSSCCGPYPEPSLGFSPASDTTPCFPPGDARVLFILLDCSLPEGWAGPWRAQWGPGGASEHRREEGSLSPMSWVSGSHFSRDPGTLQGLRCEDRRPRLLTVPTPLEGLRGATSILSCPDTSFSIRGFSFSLVNTLHVCGG